jgi:hypothetical protein
VPYLLVDTVLIEDVDMAKEGLHGGLIPFVKSMPGFVRGTWSADREAGKGIGMMVFDTRENAEAALENMRTNGKVPPGVTLESAAIYEVQGEA